MPVSNGTLKPGSSPSGNVDLATGTVTFPLTLAAVAPVRGLETGITLQYSSAVEDQVDTWNLEAPTGPAGLGWSLLGERILRDPRGDAAIDNDAYLLITAEGAAPLVPVGSDEEGEAYVSRNSPNWKIRFRPDLELWVVIREDGNRSYYGGNDKTPFAGAKAVEWAVSWGNWLGASVSAEGQQQLALVWNLSCRENSWKTGACTNTRKTPT